MIDNSFTPSTVGKDPSGNNTAILASGDYAHLVDALAAGGLAYAKKFPVILTPTGSTTLGSQASSEISSLQIKHLIVVGGTASIPSSQYTPNPSGVTTVDVLSGADRSATSEAIEKAAVGTYGFATTKLGIAAGATFVGSTSQVQNDGADALSSAPYLGDPEPMCVTNGPTDVGSAAKCVSDVNPTTVDWLTGTANLPASQRSTILAGSSGGAPGAYTVSGGSLSAQASTATATSQGATTYTVSGLPTASGTTANVALFPCTGTAQTGNNTTNGAPTTTSGSTTFTAPGGTTPTAGTAIGQGTSSTSSAAGSVSPNSTGSVAANNASAYIASVNGVPTSATGAGNAPTQVYGVSVTNGTLSFVVNSFQLDCVIPVVYTAPSSAGTNPPLLVNANGTPQTGYAVGVGGPTAWQAPPAPSAASPGYAVQVILAPPLSGTSSFDGFVLAGPTGTAGNIYSFNFATSGSTYSYPDGTPLTQTTFGNYLSANSTSQTIPNSTTAHPYNGDLVKVGSGTGYASGAPAAFSYYDAVGTTWTSQGYTQCFNAGIPGNEPCATNTGGLDASPGFGDVPAAPTAPSASYNGSAFLVGTTSTPGIIVSWTPPANPDVSGAEAVTGGSTVLANNASYQIWRATVTGSTIGTPTQIATEAVSSSSTVNNGDGQVAAGCNASAANCTNVTSPKYVDPNFAAGQQYVYYIVAVAAPGPNGGGQPGPYSAGTTAVTAGTAATTPAMTLAVITPSSCSANCGANETVGVPTTTGGTATVTYNENVSCLTGAGPDFTYSNSGNASLANVKGASCAGTTVKQLTVTFTPYTTNTTSIGCTVAAPCYTYQPITAPANGDTFTYTAPSTNTTSNAVFAGTTGSPVFAATQTLTGNGQVNTSNASPVNPVAPAPSMSSAHITAASTTLTITYDEPVLCSTVDADGSDYTVKINNGTTADVVTAAACAGTTNTTVTLTLTTAPAAASGTATVTAKNGTDTNTVTDQPGNAEPVGDTTTSNAV